MHTQSDTTGLFGVPLETVLERQKARHPELRVPQLIDAGLRFLVKHGALVTHTNIHARTQKRADPQSNQ